LKNGLENLKRELAAVPGRQSAGRIGARQGKVSELTAIIPLARPSMNCSTRSGSRTG
jgi:hypothetical protein